jgi:tRNA A37 threonylcarbamoyladenosine dehydratase
MDAAYLERFAGVARLVGRQGARQLSQTSFIIVGLGGVGSWAAEALARSGVGQLTLVDGDTVCASNTNRQLHALEGYAGKFKAEVMAERVRAIHPAIRAQAVNRFIIKEEAASFLNSHEGIVLDAIDSLSPKCALLAACRRAGRPALTTGGCAGRLDGTRVRVGDLAASKDDPLLRLVRKKLRQELGFPRKGPMGIACAWSDEPLVMAADCADIPGAIMPEGEGLRPNCEWGYGTMAHVAGAFGLALAGEAIRIALAAAVAPGSDPSKD